MSGLDRYALWQLELEVQNRRRQMEEAATNRPIPLKKKDWLRVEELCDQFIRRILAQEQTDGLDHAVFEAVIEAVYGPNVWGWINKWQR